MSDIQVIERKGLGWVPDIPDIRDYDYEEKLGKLKTIKTPPKTSIRPNCSPVRDQRGIGACTGFAVAGAVEYLRRTDADEFSTLYSPMFVYYEARAMDNSVEVDVGAYIRHAIKVVNHFGAAPESTHKYYEPEANFAKKPPKSAYEQAKRWKSGSYYRCEGLDAVIDALAKGYPVVGGFSVYSSMWNSTTSNTGRIPMPSTNDYLEGGHAVLFTGYDKNTQMVEFKNSWGTSWGDDGYGYLPFGYLTNRKLSDDFWTITAESAETNPND